MIHGARLPVINTWPSKFRMCVISQHSYAGSKSESYKIMTKMFRLGETQHRKLERLELGSGVQGVDRFDVMCVSHNVNAATSLPVHDAVLLACPSARWHIPEGKSSATPL